MTFSGNIAVITGGADGMGKSLAMKLVRQNCSVAICDLSTDKLATAQAELEEAARKAETSAQVSIHVCDVAEEQQCVDFATAVASNHTLNDRTLLLFNNAGVELAYSMITDSRESWEKTFNVCWGGVYLMTRAFLPLLLKAPAGYVVNTSSVNGFWSSLGFLKPHTAYASAKHAVKGFTESLMEDFRLNAPHLKAICVMPGLIGTGLMQNSTEISGGADASTLRDRAQTFLTRVQELKDQNDPALREMEPDKLFQLRLLGCKNNAAGSDAAVLESNSKVEAGFRNNPYVMTADDAADIILQGIVEGKWRILVGGDAERLDKLAREQPVDLLDNPSLAMKAVQGI